MQTNVQTIARKIGEVKVSGYWLEGSQKFQNLLTLNIGDVPVMAFADDFESLQDCFVSLKRFVCEVKADGLEAMYNSLVPMDVEFLSGGFVIKPSCLEVY